MPEAQDLSNAAPSEAKVEDGAGKRPVALWVYDLSGGMALSMSKSLLGKQIDGVWHTAIVAYGYEYYFGGGIQAVKPGKTQAGTPVQRLQLGMTSVTQEKFHEWLKSVSEKYAPETYNLISNNCNNFSNEASKFLVGKPIPSHITSLSEDVINTPMGQMLRPMLEKMQNVVEGGSKHLDLPPLSNDEDDGRSPELEKSVFRLGAKVTITGLKKAANLNGMTGEIIGEKKGGRYPVKIIKMNKKVNVKIENLFVSEQNGEGDVSRFSNLVSMLAGEAKSKATNTKSVSGDQLKAFDTILQKMQRS